MPRQARAVGGDAPKPDRKYPILGFVLLAGGAGALYWWATSTRKPVSTEENSGGPVYLVPAGFLPRETLVVVDRGSYVGS